MSEQPDISSASEATTMRFTVAKGPDEDLLQCEACGTPVDREQRYCLNCGTRRQGVNDPAARYLSEAGAARSRVAKATARAATASPRRTVTSGLVLALLIALIPVGVAVGVSVGRSSNNQAAKLISAIAREREQVVRIGGGGASTAVNTSSSSHKSKTSGKSSSKAPTTSSLKKQAQANLAASKKVASQTSHQTGTNVTKEEANNTGLQGLP